MPTVDWTAIRQAYESGISKNTLSKLHGISRQAIIKRANKEHWITPLVTSPEHFVTSPVTDNSPVETGDPVELSEIEIVEKALRQLAKYLEGEGLIGLNQHKLFADALSQYIKLKLTIPTEQETSPYDMRDFLAKCTAEELKIIQPVIDAVAARDKAAADEKVKPIRRIG